MAPGGAQGILDKSPTKRGDSAAVCDEDFAILLRACVVSMFTDLSSAAGKTDLTLAPGTGTMSSGQTRRT